MKRQSICKPVANEIGESPNIGLLTDPSFDAVFTDVASQQLLINARLEDDLASGQAAEATRRVLGCDACELAQLCPTKQALDIAVIQAARSQELENKFAMLAEAPGWLSAARLQNLAWIMNPKGDIADLLAIHDIASLVKKFTDSSLDPDTLLAGSRNRLFQLYRAGDVEELVDNIQLRANDETALLESHIITTAVGDFEVIDASSLSRSKHAPHKEAYGVLVSKLLDRMSNADQFGKPLIFSPDNIMQKRITTNVTEIRMAGKGRLYIVARPSNNNLPARVVILGSHGADERAQSKFIDNTIR